MQIGCPTEIKPQEFRVGMTPNAVSEATRHGHKVDGSGRCRRWIGLFGC
jgi:alanine dehydrogenase